MTTITKITVLVSATVLCLSLGSLIILNNTQRRQEAKPPVKFDSLVRVAVLNGCGREGLASLCARRLRDEGFDVVNGMGGNADSFDFDVSVVVDRRGDARKVRMIADKAGIKEIINQHSDNPYIIEDIVFIIGRDWDTLSLFREEGKD